MHLEKLLEDLDNQKIIVPGKEEAPEGAEHFGIVPEELRPMFSRMTEYGRALEQAKLDYRHNDDESKDKELFTAAHQLLCKRDLLRAVFWYELQASLGVFGQNDLQLDKNWQVYRAPASPLEKALGGFVMIGGSDGLGSCGPDCGCGKNRSDVH